MSLSWLYVCVTFVYWIIVVGVGSGVGVRAEYSLAGWVRSGDESDHARWRGAEKNSAGSKRGAS